MILWMKKWIWKLSNFQKKSDNDENKLNIDDDNNDDERKKVKAIVK